MPLCTCISHLALVAQAPCHAALAGMAARRLCSAAPRAHHACPVTRSLSGRGTAPHAPGPIHAAPTATGARRSGRPFQPQQPPLAFCMLLDQPGCLLLCPSSADYDGRSALMLACVKGFTETAALLLSAGAQVGGRAALFPCHRLQRETKLWAARRLGEMDRRLGPAACQGDLPGLPSSPRAAQREGHLWGHGAVGGVQGGPGRPGLPATPTRRSAGAGGRRGGSAALHLRLPGCAGSRTLGLGSHWHGAIGQMGGWVEDLWRRRCTAHASSGAGGLGHLGFVRFGASRGAVEGWCVTAAAPGPPREALAAALHRPHCRRPPPALTAHSLL